MAACIAAACSRVPPVAPVPPAAPVPPSPPAPQVAATSGFPSDPAAYEVVAGVSALPHGVMLACADGKGRLADSDAPWQDSDVIDDESLPQRRLVWARNAGRFYLMECESGGITALYEAVAVEKDASSDAVEVRARKVLDADGDAAAAILALGLGPRR